MQYPGVLRSTNLTSPDSGVDDFCVGVKYS